MELKGLLVKAEHMHVSENTRVGTHAYYVMCAQM